MPAIMVETQSSYKEEAETTSTEKREPTLSPRQGMFRIDFGATLQVSTGEPRPERDLMDFLKASFADFLVSLQRRSVPGFEAQNSAAATRTLLDAWRTEFLTIPARAYSDVAPTPEWIFIEGEESLEERVERLSRKYPRLEKRLLKRYLSKKGTKAGRSPAEKRQLLSLTGIFRGPRDLSRRLDEYLHRH
ncbi:MAG: hypothetical protein ACE5KI_05500 [Dehalococcoidia bacterium]